MKDAINYTRDFQTEKDSFIETENAPQKFSLKKRIALFVAALAAAFLLGLIPMQLSMREAVEQRDAAQANLRLSQMQNRLATAAIETRRGEYEQARMRVSDFYTDLRAEIDRSESAFTVDQREELEPILSQRDDVITLLARSDPAAVERLADLYLVYKQAVDPAQKQPQQ